MSDSPNNNEIVLEGQNSTQKAQNKKQLQWNETDLLSDRISELKMSALRHASKIGPYVTNCTLGGNQHQPEIKGNGHEIPVLEKRNDLKINKSVKMNEIKNKENKNLTSKLNTTRKNEILDYKTVNDIILYKSLEKERINEIKQKEQEFIENKIKIEDKKLQEIYEKFNEEHKNWLKNKIDTEKQIFNEIDLKIENELEKFNENLNETRKKTETHIKRITIDGIVEYQKCFKLYYERIIKLLKTASIMKLPNCDDNYNKNLKNLIMTFDALKQNVKNEIIGLNELNKAKNLCIEIRKLELNLLQDIENFEKNLNNELEKIKNDNIIQQQQQQQENTGKICLAPNVSVEGINPTAQRQQQSESLKNQQQQQQLQSLNQQQQQQQQQQEQTQVDSASSLKSNENSGQSSAPSTFVNTERLTFYNSIMTFYTSKVDAVKPLQADDTMKKYRFACQKAINTPVNAISGVSPQHLQDKFDKIFSFIIGNPLKTTDGGVISTSDHPLGRDYCLLLLAKKFVGQGDSLVSSNAQTAFPIASIIVSIWKNIPDFGKLFLAYTFKECPYLVPYYLPQYKGQSNEDYFKSLGYRLIDGILENQDMYLKRQSGYMRLYSAVMITESRLNDSQLIHPYSLDNGWKWLTNLLNSEPLPDICATLIYEFLQMVGYNMWKLYGKQFYKILLTIQNEYFPKLSKVDEGGPKSRLEIFLQKVIQDGKINKPIGTLSKHFW